MATPRNTKAKKISQRKKQVAEAKKMASRKAPKKTAPSKLQQFEDNLNLASGKTSNTSKVKSNRSKTKHDQTAKTEHVRKTAAAKRTVKRLTKKKK